MVEQMEQLVQLVPPLESLLLWYDLVVALEEVPAHAEEVRDAQVVLVVTVERASVEQYWNVRSCCVYRCSSTERTTMDGSSSVLELEKEAKSNIGCTTVA